MPDLGQIDRLTGWHLLIDAEPGRKVYFEGCPDGVANHWCDLRGEVRVYSRHEADLQIFWCVAGSREIRVFPAELSHRDVSDVRRYALLPASEPRLVLPLDNRNQLQRGLVLHRPGRPILQLGTLALEMLVACGFSRPIASRVLSVSSRLLSCPEIDPASVLYLGSADACRKTTILPPKRGFILKLGQNMSSRNAIRAEAQALSFLNDSPLANRVPRIFGLYETRNGLILKQEFRTRFRRQVRAKDPEIFEFLVDLSRIGAETRNGVPGHRSHGDFAPWNTIFSHKGLFVFDWEMSQAWAPALTDAFHFAVAPFVHIPGTGDAVEAETHALELGFRVAQATGIPAEQVLQLWQAWLKSQPFAPTNPLIDELAVRAS